ncbi:hypothetical protein OHA21_04590 [Actinoplanes sp. NBC_00393]|uniref:hypothetical protein n=1 Tax=Actinoplanes sp. NBC_00393 TaxID=2975953 RepID=UPI002E1A9174
MLVPGAEPLVAQGDQTFLREQACGALRNAEYSPTLVTGLINLILTDDRWANASKFAADSLVQVIRQHPAAAEEVADRLAELFDGLPSDALPGLRWDLYRALGQIAAIAEART